MKKTNFVRLLSLLLALLMMAAVFTACKKEEAPADGETEGVTGDAQNGGEIPASDLWTAETEGVIDLSEYKIVRPKDMDKNSLVAVTAFKQYITSYCGVEIVAATDAKADKDEKEILMGVTNRKASKEAAVGMKAHDWKISVVGNKIVIVGGDKASLASATNWLIENNSFQKGNKYAKLGASMDYKYEYGVADLKAGDKVLDSVNVVVSAKDSIAYVDVAANFADELIYASGIKTSVSTRVSADALNVYVMSAEQAKTLLPAGVTIGNMQYVIVKTADNNIVVAGYDDIGTEIGAQKVLKAINGANKAALDLYSLCNNTPVAYTYGGNEDNTLMLSSGAEYRIMQYNILRTEVGAGRYGYAINTIKYYSPDVVGFEEYCKDYTANFTPMLEAAGYTVLGNQLDEVVNDTGIEVRPLYPLHQNNTPIAFKTEKFELLDSGWKRMIDSTDPVQKGHGWNGYNTTWAVLKDKTTGDVFGVTSLHNFAGTNDLSTETRVRVVRDLINIVKANIVDKYNCPVFSIGDYNTNETTESYAEMLNSDVIKYSDSRYVSEKGYSAGASMHTTGVQLTKVGTTVNTIDHLFVTAGIRVIRHRFANTMEPVKSSDHYPVYIDVTVG